MPGNKSLEIKGVREGLLVRLSPTEDWKALVKQFVNLIDKQRDFFRGARLALDVGERSLRRQELGTLQHMLSDRGVILWAVLSESMTTLSTARKLELQTSLQNVEAADRGLVAAPAESSGAVPATLLRTDEDEKALPLVEPEEIGTAGVLVKRTLRSGRTVRSEGHVVVIGDVNPGAQIFAGGDVIIWGRLRGMVHAGVHGDEGVTVCALDMMPMQLRIAGHIATSPKEKSRVPRPEVARVRDNRIVVEAWD